MRSLVTYISAFALVAHFTVGCCWHQAECTAAAVACTGLEACAGHEHDEIIAGRNLASNHGQCPESGRHHAPTGGCRHVICSALLVHKSTAPDGSQPSLAFALLLPTVPENAAPGSFALGLRQTPGVPPRLNVLHQVFLI